MLCDGENIKGSMDDVGTRMQFLTELYELWQTALDICIRYDNRSPFYEGKRAELEGALKLLSYHMEKDYSDSSYKRIIESLPKHGEDIPNT